MLRNSLAALMLASVAATAAAQQQTFTLAPSSRATAIVTLSPPRGVQGVSSQRIRIEYGQPHLRGRKLHTGDLVPLETVWRLGANAATELETDVDLVLGGQTIPKGKYTLFALPSAAGWKLIVNRNTGQWGTDYKPEHDLARVDLRKRTLASPVESFSMWLIPSGRAGSVDGELRFAWGDVELSTDWTAKP